MKVIISNYTHPEGYPPTFNTINNLSKYFDEVIVLSKDTLPTEWQYDSNVRLILQEDVKNRFDVAKKSVLDKLSSYWVYFTKLRSLLRKEQPELLILHDSIPLFFYILSKFTLLKTIKTKVWYHNHDISPLSYYKKYSLIWFGALFEKKFLNRCDYFSLPALERKEYFSMDTFQGRFYFIPNYPSQLFHGKLNLTERKIKDRINVIYPGNLSDIHGFEEFIPHLGQLDDKKIHFTLLGDIREDYKKKLLDLAASHDVSEFLHFQKRISYIDMPQFMETYHIGWAVNKPLDVTYATGGTAANKIYEFLALGMPIILFDNKHYRKHLANNDWAFFSDLKQPSLQDCIVKIIDNYSELQKSARLAFEKDYFFEKDFLPVLKEVIEDLK